MIREFEKLESKEVELMQKSPILVCILIAGADHEIDKKEIKGSIELSKKKHKKFKGSSLSNFYLDMSEDFEDKLKMVIQSYPNDAKRRNAIITEELSQINKIWPKLDRTFAQEFYKSIKDIALNTAESSGGLLGLNKIGDEEAELVKLPMIQDPAKL
jgi:hypothetical protein